MKAKLALTPEQVKMFLIKGLTIEGYKVDPNTLKINFDIIYSRGPEDPQTHAVFSGANIDVELGPQYK